MFRGAQQAMLLITVSVVLAISAVPGRAQVNRRDILVGSWHIATYDLEFQDTGERRPTLGARPNGYIVFLPNGRMMAYLEAEGRTAPQTDAERAAAYRTLSAYTGKYRVEGNKWITTVDAAWNVVWIGTSQEREFALSGDDLTVVTQWNPNPLYVGRATRGRLTFKREP